MPPDGLETINPLIKSKMLELRAATTLGTLWERTGRSEKALQLMREAYGAFTEGSETTDLRAARALLDRLEAKQRS